MNGEVVSFGYDAIVLDPVNGATFGHTVMIGTTGLVTGYASNAAILLYGNGNSVLSSGDIQGGVGVRFEDCTNGLIDNDGTISGRFAGVRLVNSSGTDIFNSGSIRGHAGIELASSTATIVNIGEIVSTRTTLAAIEGTAASAGYALRNDGSITGIGNAIDGSAFTDRIVNTGILNGNVALGSGNDIFRSRTGEILGDLSGENGNDSLIGGITDDLIFGGSGNDTIDGGAGNDLLSGGANNDIFSFTRGGGDDRVTDFANGSDDLDLRGFHFANFAAVSARATDVTGALKLDLTPLGGGLVLVNNMTRALFDAGDVLI